MKKSPLSFVVLLAMAVSFSPVFAGDLADDASLSDILTSAKEQNKPVLLEFTGSDWCPPCKMMNKQVFSTEEFQKFSTEKLVFVKVDFPRNIKQTAEVKARNQDLQEKFDVEGYPTVVLLSPEGKVLGQEVGLQPGGAQSFIKWINESVKGSEG